MRSPSTKESPRLLSWERLERGLLPRALGSSVYDTAWVASLRDPAAPQKPRFHAAYAAAEYLQLCLDTDHGEVATVTYPCENFDALWTARGETVSAAALAPFARATHYTRWVDKCLYYPSRIVDAVIESLLRLSTASGGIG